MVLDRVRHEAEQKLGLPKLESLLNVSKNIPDKGTMGLFVKVLDKIPPKETIDALTNFVQSIGKLLPSAQGTDGKIMPSAPDIDKITKLMTVASKIDLKEANAFISNVTELIKLIPAGGFDSIMKMLEEAKKDEGKKDEEKPAATEGPTSG